MRILNWALALLAVITAFINEVVLFAIPPALRLVGAVGNLSEIRLLDDLGYGERALTKADVLKVGTGKDAIDPKTAEAWVRAGLAISTDPEDAGDPPAPARSKVVVHDRGGMELLQAASTYTPDGSHEGPAPVNPTDSDVETDAEAGASRTAAGDVIAENAEPEPVAKAGAKKGRK